MSQAKSDVKCAVQKAFDQLDKNQDDKICKDELKILLDKILGSHYPSTYLDFIMEKGDRNGSGTIDTLDELVDALTSVKAIIVCCRLIAVLDTDKDGYLTKEEIESKLKNCEYPEVINLLSDVPLSSNGSISCEDFFGHILEKLGMV